MKDDRGLDITGATPGARDAFERALHLHLSWRRGAADAVRAALEEAPGFVMAHVLEAYLHLGSRDWAQVQRARASYEHLRALPANEREALHVAAIGAGLSDDFDAMSGLLLRLNRAHPRDALALQFGHAVDYLTGDLERLEGRVSSALPSWSDALPGHASVLAMAAFALVENAEFERALPHALHALELDPGDARAHHALAHAFEMRGDPAGGLRWLEDGLERWTSGTVAATHLWWHWAVFHLSREEAGRALAIYDRHIRPGPGAGLADLIDGAELLWRLHLSGVEVGDRWQAVAAGFAPHLDRGYCSFTDVHAMLALVGAGRWSAAEDLHRRLAVASRGRGRYPQSTRLIGLPAARALLAHGRGDHDAAARLLAAVPAHARRLGGSHAQRDVLYLTLRDAIRRQSRREVRPAA